LKVQPNKQQALGAAMAAVGLALLTISDLSVHVGDVLAFIQVVVVGMLSLVWSIATGEFSTPHTSQALTTIVVLGIGGTAVGYFVQTKAQVESPPSRIALILVLEPVFGGLFGYLLGGDRLSVINLSGAVLIIVAMVVTEFKPRMRAVSS
jgi:drug/metabolite transporter (DMT)-like permease